VHNRARYICTSLTSFTHLCTIQRQTSISHDILHTVLYNTARDIFPSRHSSHSCVQHSKIHPFLTKFFTQLCTTQQDTSFLYDILHTVVYNTARDIFPSRHSSHSFVQYSKRHLLLTKFFTQLCTTQQDTSFLYDILHTVVYNTARDIFPSRHSSHSFVQYSKRHLFLTKSFTQLCTTQQDTSFLYDILHTVVYNTARDIFPSRHSSHSFVQHSKRHLFLTKFFTQLCTTQQDTSFLYDILHTVVYNTARDIFPSRHSSHSFVQYSKRHLFLTKSFTQLCTTEQEIF